MMVCVLSMSFRLGMIKWCEMIGLKKEHVHEHEIADADRAFYSKKNNRF